MTTAAPLTVDWSRYASQYDAMCAANSAYRDLHRHVTELALALDVPADARVLEVGAGTGNYILSLAKERPSWKAEAADINPVMLSTLQAKAKSRSLPVAIHEVDLNQAWPWDNAYDVVVAVHAILHLDRPDEALQHAFRAVRSGGYLVIADIARPIDLEGWITAIKQDIYQSTLAGTQSASQAEAAAQRFFEENSYIIEANRIFDSQYAQRQMTQMPLAEFCEALRGLGFQIVQASDGHYRNHSNVVVAQKG